jgi:dipeptidyl aminopeptidase/acylaminoacyl peptidase
MVTGTPPLPSLTPTPDLHPLSIAYLRARNYPGSDIVFEETLPSYDLYNRYLVSYQSEDLTIYAYMTIPKGDVPAAGWPAINFNHGYIPPKEYVSTERYTAYMDRLANSGYIIFRPDYRGHGESEGSSGGAYGNPGYTIDVLNALTSLKKLPVVDKGRIGMWGHSMGGYITLRSMVIAGDIQAGVIWGGVVGTYEDLAFNWRRSTGSLTAIPSTRGYWRRDLATRYGNPDENPEFWNSISANSYLNDLSGPIQLHHGENDETVPIRFSEQLAEQITLAGGLVEYYAYPGDNHNISNSFELAMRRSVDFFDQHLKNQP